MSWTMVGEPKTRKVTAELAKKFATMLPAPYDRPLNDTRCALLRKAMELGTFRTCEWATAECDETSLTYRVNGKHTSVILNEMNGTFPKNLTVSMQHYQCEKLEDVAALYATFDPRSSAKTVSDIYLQYAAANPGLAGVTRQTIGRAATGMAYEIWPGTSRHQAPEARAELLLTNTDFVLWLDNMLAKNTTTSQAKHLTRSSVIAAMFRTWKKAHGDATEFWSAVRDGSGATPKLPDRVLEKYLLTHGLEVETDKTTTRRDMFVKCMHAWNAWRTDSTTDLKVYSNSPIPAAK